MGFLAVLGFVSSAIAADILVFAAASTTNAIDRINTEFQKQGLGTVSATFGSSGVLGRQIMNGAPAHILISANRKWIYHLRREKMIHADQHKALVTNRLALIAPMGSKIRLAISRDLPIVAALKDGRLAIADPVHVPAGKYAKSALVNLGVWDRVARKTILTRDVRATLALVERAEAGLGIVYTTDAKISKKVKLIGVFPQKTHPAIRYGAAIVSANSTETAMRYYAFLWSEPAQAIFRSFGFDIHGDR